MKQQIGNDKGFREKPRKGGTFLCARKAPKRKKKKGAYNEGGYPIYTSTVDGKLDCIYFSNIFSRESNCF